MVVHTCDPSIQEAEAEKSPQAVSQSYAILSYIKKPHLKKNLVINSLVPYHL